MRRFTSIRSFINSHGTVLGVLLALVILVGPAVAPSSQTPPGGMTLTPSQVEIGTSATVTITSPGFFDLSEVKASEVGIRPSAGISDMSIGATAQRMQVSFKISADTSEGTRTLFIKRKGVNVVALDLVLKLPRHVCRPACTGHTSCKDNRCEHDGTICTPTCGRCQRCVANFCRELTCTPACDKNANPPEFCECGVCVKRQ